MLITLRDYFLLFLFYAILGWIIEVIYAYATKKKLTNRGFLIGPYCPIYGIGAVLIIVLLSGYKNHPAGMFVLAIVIASALEYFTSFIMEKLFKARWWNYSKTKYNINGRVCADTMIPFGIIACIIMYVINPVVISFMNNISGSTLDIIAIVCAAALLTDIITSFNIVNNFKKTIKRVSLEDRTDDINNYIREILSKRSLLYRRLLKAFPNSYAIIKKLNKNIMQNKKD